jgi:hypothetical protein
VSWVHRRIDLQTHFKVSFIGTDGKELYSRTFEKQ